MAGLGWVWCQILPSRRCAPELLKRSAWRCGRSVPARSPRPAGRPSARLAVPAPAARHGRSRAAGQVRGAGPGAAPPRGVSQRGGSAVPSEDWAGRASGSAAPPPGSAAAALPQQQQRARRSRPGRRRTVMPHPAAPLGAALLLVLLAADSSQSEYRGGVRPCRAPSIPRRPACVRALRCRGGVRCGAGDAQLRGGGVRGMRVRGRADAAAIHGRSPGRGERSVLPGGAGGVRGGGRGMRGAQAGSALHRCLSFSCSSPPAGAAPGLTAPCRRSAAQPCCCAPRKLPSSCGRGSGEPTRSSRRPSKGTWRGSAWRSTAARRRPGRCLRMTQRR